MHFQPDNATIKGRALADIGDWYLLIEKFHRAQDLYEEGYRVLAGDDATAELAAGYMTEPQPMDILTNPFRDAIVDKSGALPETGLEVSMTVTGLGSIRDVEFLDAPEELTKDQLKRIRYQLQRIPSRPAIRDGEVLTTREFNWRYRITPPEEAS